MGRIDILWRLYVLILIFELANIVCSEKIRYDFAQLLEQIPSDIPLPYEIIYPHRILKGQRTGISTKETKIGHHGTYEHLEQVTFQLIIDESSHKIKLRRNDALLSHGISVKHYLDENQQVISKTVEHCYYQGQIKHIQGWSSVAVSTCNGIRGIINLNNETYIIQPLKGDLGMRHPHLVFKASKKMSQSCGNDLGQWQRYDQLHRGEFIQRVKHLRAIQSRNPNAPTKERNVKLALILDNTMCTDLKMGVSEMTELALQTVNTVDLYFNDLKIRISLVYVELWNEKDRMTVTSNLRENFKQLAAYRKLHIPDIQHHLLHFITGQKLQNNSIGMAIPDSVCTERALGISANPSFSETQKLATVLAHMMGHNLGLKHDEDGGCDCSDKFGCIMSTHVLLRTGFHSRKFSSCSKEDLDVAVSLDVASCLNDDPEAEETFIQKCGNLHVERGEECDCGSPEECDKNDPCCDPHTCLLKSWAQCKSGSCCHNCTFLPSHYVCREKASDCDVPELCPGNSGECPSNNYVVDGNTCANDTGYCMSGICPTLTQQCQYIWGPDASGANMQCFEKFNPTGNFNGHCGKDESTGWFAKCLPENIQCGLLHCEGGNKLPLFISDKSFSKTTVFNNDIEYDCKAIYGPAVMSLPHYGLVQEGTKCGANKICKNKQCISLSSLPNMKCPGTIGNTVCGGHGVCTKAGSCFCEQGWTSENCSQKVAITVTTGVWPKYSSTVKLTTTMTTTTHETIKLIPIEKTTTSIPEVPSVYVAEDDSLSTELLFIILGGVILSLVLILAFTFLCYRRKSPVKLSKSKKGFFGLKKKSEKEDKFLSSESKIIKFGSLPSYKVGKGFGKKRRGLTSEEESDMELPPPPIIISNPDSAKPERGILKNFQNKTSSDERRSSSSQTERSESTCDQEETYQYDDDEDAEAGEIRDILSRRYDPEKSMEMLDQLAETSSFDYVLPNPNLSSTSSNRSNSPQRRNAGYDYPPTTAAKRPTLWKNSPKLSPPKSKIIRMKNIDELIHEIDRHRTVELSPSPDELQMQVSPTTSEEVRSSSTEDRSYNNGRNSQSPQSITSGSARDAYQPFLGCHWTKLNMMAGNNLNKQSLSPMYDMDSSIPNISIPPPMSPLQLRNFLNFTQTGLNREFNDTPLGSQIGDGCSTNGTSNSRCGYEKSSGYGSEHDPERFSMDGMSGPQSRSGSTSPPSYSAVIHSGPNKIKLLPVRRLHESGLDDHESLQRLLQELPRIDAGAFERSPLLSNSCQEESFQSDRLPSPHDSLNCDDSSSRNTEIFLDNAPCIDCSLESIPHSVQKCKKSKLKSVSESQQGKDNKKLNDLSNKYSDNADVKLNNAVMTTEVPSV